jgi:anti-anti-sigma factor
MEIHGRVVGSVRILDLKGKLVLDEGLTRLRDEIESARREGHDLLLNLAAVPYIDSAGLGEIVRSQAALGRPGEKLKLLHVNERVRDLLSVAHLHSILEVFDSEEAAVESFS